MRAGEPAFTLIASDIDALESLWEQLMGVTPLNRKATYHVAIFQKSDVQTDPIQDKKSTSRKDT